MAESKKAQKAQKGQIIESEPGDDWSAGQLIALGAVFLAAFFVFIYNVSL